MHCIVCYTVLLRRCRRACDICLAMLPAPAHVGAGKLLPVAVAAVVLLSVRLAGAAQLSVGGQVATLRAGFVSFNIDFDNRPRQLQAGFYTVNFSDARLVAAASALSPAALRIGGGDEDKQVYGVGDFAPANCSAVYDPWTVRNKSVANCRLVTPQRYSELFGFAKATGLRLVFAFNPFYGYCCHSACLGHCDRQSAAPQQEKVAAVVTSSSSDHPPPSPPGCAGRGLTGGEPRCSAARRRSAPR